MEFLNYLLSAKSMSEVFTMVSAVATTITAVVALVLAFRTDKAERIRTSDEAVIERIEIFLSRAYQVLASGTDGQSLPENPSRHDWLTAARMIEEHKKIVKDVKLPHNKLKMEAMREFWRTRFVNLFRAFDFDVTYFARTGPSDAPLMPIAPNSAMIVFDFLNWPRGVQDPIDLVDERLLTVPRQYQQPMRAINDNARRGASAIVRGGRPPMDPPRNN